MWRIIKTFLACNYTPGSIEPLPRRLVSILRHKLTKLAISLEISLAFTSAIIVTLHIIYALPENVVVQKDKEMKMNLPDTWQKNKRYFIVTSITIIFTGTIFFIGYRLHWKTGFAGKTLWDWMQLLIIPSVLLIGGFIFNLLLSRTEQQRAQRREEIDREIARDNQRAAILQAYLDQIAELVLEYFPKELDYAIAIITRHRTLTVLHSLDSNRKKIVLEFLNVTSLAKKSDILNGADLSGDDLSGIDLSGANLREVNAHGANLSGSNLSKAILNETFFRNTKLNQVDLREANLSMLNLSGVNLSKFDLSGTDLSGTDLSNANLSGANLTGANLSDTNLSGTNLILANLSGAKLCNVDLCGLDLRQTVLKSANLKEANLSKANLSGVDLSGAIFRGTDLSNANLSGANLTGAILSHTDLKDFAPRQDLLNTDEHYEVEMSDTNRNTNLSKADLSGANLSEANLIGANLKGADLSGASLNGAILYQADLSGANLTSANQSNTIVTKEQLQEIACRTFPPPRLRRQRRL